MQYFLDFLADSSVTSRLHVDSQVTPRLPLENLYIKSIIVTGTATSFVYVIFVTTKVLMLLSFAFVAIYRH